MPPRTRAISPGLELLDGEAALRHHLRRKRSMPDSAIAARSAAVSVMASPAMRREGAGAEHLDGAGGGSGHLASVVNIGAFNLGNAAGAALGRAVIAGGLGYSTVALAGARASAAGLALVLLTLRRRLVSAAAVCGAGALICDARRMD